MQMQLLHKEHKNAPSFAKASADEARAGEISTLEISPGSNFF
jgi:hypothetical protein